MTDKQIPLSVPDILDKICDRLIGISVRIAHNEESHRAAFVESAILQFALENVVVLVTIGPHTIQDDGWSIIFKPSDKENIAIRQRMYELKTEDAVLKTVSSFQALLQSAVEFKILR